ncbi:hypothetical protein TYRP_011723 [Tyrophagus putrescentiae]|nr:hypothetical protein TYRP_011723 [Tyrophagus putrescentiae]
MYLNSPIIHRRGELLAKVQHRPGPPPDDHLLRPLQIAAKVEQIKGVRRQVSEKSGRRDWPGDSSSSLTTATGRWVGVRPAVSMKRANWRAKKRTKTVLLFLFIVLLKAQPEKDVLQSGEVVLGKQHFRRCLRQQATTSHQANRAGRPGLLDVSSSRWVQIAARRIGSTPTVGSSSTSSGGLKLPHQLILGSWQIEKGDNVGGASLKLFRRHSIELAKVVQRLEDGKVRVKGKLLGHVTDAGARHRTVSTARSLAKEANLTGIWLDAAEDAFEKSGFPYGKALY